MSKALGGFDKIRSLSHWSIEQSTSQAKPNRILHSNLPEHHTWAGGVDLIQNFMTHFWLEPKSDSMITLADLSIEQIEEIRSESDWHTPLRISDLESQVNILQNQVNILQNQMNILQNQVDTLTQKEEVVDLKIDWGQVQNVVEAVASELNWNTKISIDDTENLIIVSVSEDKDNIIVETEFDFYSLIKRKLSQDVFKVINFLFISDYD